MVKIIIYTSIRKNGVFMKWHICIFLVLSLMLQQGFCKNNYTPPQNKISTPKSNSLNSNNFSYPFVEVAQSCTPSTVFIRAEGISERSYDPNDMFNDEFFRHFFGGPQRPKGPQISQGSGFLVSKDGFIMTNLHVVKGAKKITVHMHDGTNRQLPATYIGGDQKTDIAVIKINSKTKENFPYLELANSNDVQVGEWVVAIGNPFSLEASVSAGIISAKGRQGLQITDFEDFIQTDAAINPGNSGGPLINLDQKVIGMNTAIISQSGGYMGIGFAIPSNILVNIKNQLIETGVVTRGFLGVSLQPIDSDLAEAFGSSNTQGALVAEVVKGSPAETAGIIQGDIITKMNDNNVKSPGQLRNDIILQSPGTKVKFSINRNGKMKNIFVTLGEFGTNTLVSSTTASQMLGFTVDNLTNENIQSFRFSQELEGIVIVAVEPGGPAQSVGLMPGSIIMAINHKKIANVSEFNDALSGTKSGDRVLLLVRQGDMMRFFTIRAE